MARRLRLRVGRGAGARVAELKLAAIDGRGGHRGRPLRAYIVIEHGRNVGIVWERTETLERKTRGKRYVNARWTGAKTVWHAGDGRFPYRTRMDAIARLLGYDYAERV